MPPLRERVEEIPLLVNYFVERYSRLYKRSGFSVPPAVMDRLLQHRYQGNVRELENIVKRMIVLNDPWLTRVSLRRGGASEPPAGVAPVGEMPTLSLRAIVREAAQAAERRTIVKALEQTRWNRVKTAKLLKLSYRGLLYKIKQNGLDAKQALRQDGV